MRVAQEATAQLIAYGALPFLCAVVVSPPISVMLLVAVGHTVSGARGPYTAVPASPLPLRRHGRSFAYPLCAACSCF